MLSRNSGFLLFALTGVGLCGLAGTGGAREGEEPPATPEQAAFFETRVRPVLATKCLPCHGASAMGGVRLDGPGDLGRLVDRGDAAKSLLLHVVDYKGPVKMPPSGPLPAAQIADLKAWIEMGAPWPGKAPVRKQDLPLWSLKPVRKPALPAVKAKAWVRNPVDAFTLARMEAKGLRPAPEADRRTLIRRVGYDLTGLPPTAAETSAFLLDKRPDAYERVVDRLLASPRYGERWARQWLDVARYADTKGYVFNEDREYRNAYTFRAWTIAALNKDLPYDRFVMDQLAADRLPEGQGEDRTALAAMGFLTLGRRFLNDTPSIIDDRIDVTMRGLQGFTVACARCHDHKFDPIPTQDYYALYGVFDSSEDRTPAISPKPLREPYEAYLVRLREAEDGIRGLVLAETARLRTSPPEEVKGVLQGLGVGALAEGDARAKLLPFFAADERERLGRLETSLDALRKNPPPMPEFAMALGDRKDAHDGVVFKRGNPGNRGEAAPRRFLKALSKGERPLWTDGSGRLELARAIASKENPLTARVFVNRVWQGHFGQGIVRTASDFGHQGEKPTHPELLDWLAATFMERGWSMKGLHRLMVTSATYRQRSGTAPAGDSENRLLSVMPRRRLDLEAMRDSLTMASGGLDVKEIGGHSVDLWSRPFTGRRAVYGYVERQNLPGVFRTFDFASPDTTSPKRFYTTVPQQALFFLNSPFVVERAQALAGLPEVAGAKDEAQRVRRLYLRVLGRLPDAAETAAGVAYLGRGAPSALRGVWSYGYGGWDGTRVSFTPFGTFVDGRYQAKAKFPEEEFGYVSLGAGGGHPGRDASHAAVRRWTAPADLTVTVGGVLRHGQEPGNGVRARIVARRRLIGEWRAHHGEARTEATFAVRKGETVDFLVDPLAGDNSDGYGWTPTLTAGEKRWDAAAEFAGPPPPPLSRVALYAQALLMTDEFLFVD